MNNWPLIGTLPRRFNIGHSNESDMTNIESSWQCANKGPIINGSSILSHSSVTNGACYLAGMRESLKKRGIIESDSENEVAAINTCITLYKNDQVNKTSLSL